MSKERRIVKFVPRMVTKIVCVSLLTLLLAGLTGVGAASASTQQAIWTRQFGSSEWTQAHDMAVYGSGVYVVGTVFGSLNGQPIIANGDAFLCKYDVYGDLKWTRQFGTDSTENTWAVAVDCSGIYVAGGTNNGTFPGQTLKGGVDAFVCKYDFWGNLKWMRQFGTSKDEEAIDVAVYGSAVYVAGYVEGAFPGQTHRGGIFDAFVRKYDTYGNLKWTRQFGSSENDEARGVAVYDSAVYVVGETGGALPGQTFLGGYDDAFVRKYDVYGDLKWTRQFGSSESESASSVSVYCSAVYVAGTTDGALPGQANAGSNDAFLYKYDFCGNLKWTRQFGTSSDDDAWSVSSSCSGVYVAGLTFGEFLGQTESGWMDAFVCKFNACGNLKWISQSTRLRNRIYEWSPAGSGQEQCGHRRVCLQVCSMN